jgi:hypothetical protein
LKKNRMPCRKISKFQVTDFHSDYSVKNRCKQYSNGRLSILSVHVSTYLCEILLPPSKNKRLYF